MSREQAFAKVDLMTAELEMTASIYDGFSAAIVVKDQPRTIGLFREFDDAVQVMALIAQAHAATGRAEALDEGAAGERGMVTHVVKCWPEPFAAVKSGAKPWELRVNDRDYRTGDMLIQREWSPAADAYTGEQTEHRIGWLLRGPAFGLPEGYVIMTLAAPLPPPPAACEACGGKRYIEHEGGDGEGWPSKPEIEACAQCARPAALRSEGKPR